MTAVDIFIHNRIHYVQIVQDHKDEMDRNIVTKIMDYNLFCQAKDLREQLSPVASAIDICQKDKTGLALACDTWIGLLENPALEPHHSKVLKRFNEAILPCHLVAYLLHPTYRGSRLTQEQREVAYQWLTAKDPEYLSAAIAFDTKSAPYPATFFNATSLPPAIWWKGLQHVQLPQGFVDTMVALHVACASSASIERVFSTFGIVHSKLRNRLGTDTASKLVFCYRMLRGKHELDY